MSTLEDLWRMTTLEYLWPQKNYNSESADNTIIIAIPPIIEYGLQAKPSILYRPIVFFDAARDDNDNYNLRNFNCKFFIGKVSIICFLRP